jgi:antitoxin component of RelBE/YafQ-DinJ toxin-antitoxin module
MKELDGLFGVYRQLEAQNIFNQTGLQRSRDFRLSVEKFIADHQNPLLLQKKRAEQLLHLSLQEISSRAIASMKDPNCEQDLKDLNLLLRNYFEENLKLIELQHQKSSRLLRGEKTSEESLREQQGLMQTRKRSVESYVNQLQSITSCEEAQRGDEEGGGTVWRS